MPEIVKPFNDDMNGKIMDRLSDLASDANNNEMKAVAFVVIRENGIIDMEVYVDDADRSRLRGAVIGLAAALAES